MHAFRFPRFSIFLMLACFLAILAAIGLAAEMSRTIQATYPGAPNLSGMWWSRLPGLFAMVFVMLWTVGAVGYAILFALRRSGLHRLSSLDARHHWGRGAGNDCYRQAHRDWADAHGSDQRGRRL